MKVYHKDGKVIVELEIFEAEDLRYEVRKLLSGTEDFELAEDLYRKLYYQTLD